MNDQYPIHKVKLDWAIQPEAMGTKRKFWYRYPASNESDWLFKYPRQNTGEHWAEKIVAEIAEALKIPHARVELAEAFENSSSVESERGTATESFAQRGIDLIHGNQIMTLVVPDYQRGLAFHQSYHSLGNIFEGLRRAFGPTAMRRQAQLGLCRYLVLDALVGNTDRHHENWGVLVRSSRRRFIAKLAPSFDHASSLGRELSDSGRERRLANGTVGEYSERGQCGIYWSESSDQSPSPLGLIRFAAQQYPSLFLPTLKQLESLEPSKLDNIVSRVPATWMTEASRRFAVALLYYNCHELISTYKDISQ